MVYKSPFQLEDEEDALELERLEDETEDDDSGGDAADTFELSAAARKGGLDFSRFADPVDPLTGKANSAPAPRRVPKVSAPKGGALDFSSQADAAFPSTSPVSPRPRPADAPQPDVPLPREKPAAAQGDLFGRLKGVVPVPQSAPVELRQPVVADPLAPPAAAPAAPVTSALGPSETDIDAPPVTTAADNPAIVDRAKSAGSAYVQGVAQIASGVPKELSILNAQAARRVLDVWDRIDRGENVSRAEDPTGYLLLSPEQRIAYRKRVGAFETDPRKMTFYKAGEQLDEAVKKALPIDTRFKDDFFTTKVPQALGSATGFLATGLAGRALRLPAMLTAGTTGAFVEGSDKFEDALKHGASIEDAFTASNLGAVVGTSEAVPITRLLDRLDKGTGGSVKRLLIDTLKQASEEGIQEAFQSIVGNLIANNLVAYDPQRGTFTGVGEATGVGFTVGGIMGFLGGLIGGRRAKQMQGPQATQDDAGPPSPGDPEVGQAQDQAAAAPPQSQPARSEQTAPASAVSTIERRILRKRGYTDEMIDGMNRAEAVAELGDQAQSDETVETTDDQPSAEPASDIDAQIRDLKDPKQDRNAVWLPAATVEHLRGIGKLDEAIKAGVVMENFDGEGGILIAKNRKIAQVARKMKTQKVDLQAIIGGLTGAGRGKPEDADRVVQQTDAAGNVTQESAVAPGEAPATADQMAEPGRNVEQKPMADALAERAAKVEAEQQAADFSEQGVAAEGAGTRADPARVNDPLDVERAGSNVNTEPTEAQKEAGNYKKGHLRWNGINITIENPKGSVRKGKNPDGTEWQAEMPAAYGYLKRSKGKDGDQVDVYLGPQHDGDQAFIVDQIDPKTGKFDEHKVMLGFGDQQTALDAYNGAFSDGSGSSRVGAISQVSLNDLKAWLKTGKTKRPFGKIAARPVRDETLDFSDQADVAQSAGIEAGSPVNLDDQHRPTDPTDRALVALLGTGRPTPKNVKPAERKLLADAGYTKGAKLVPTDSGRERYRAVVAAMHESRRDLVGEKIGKAAGINDFVMGINSGAIQNRDETSPSRLLRWPVTYVGKESGGPRLEVTQKELLDLPFVKKLAEASGLTPVVASGRPDASHRRAGHALDLANDEHWQELVDTADKFGLHPKDIFTGIIYNLDYKHITTKNARALLKALEDEELPREEIIESLSRAEISRHSKGDGVSFPQEVAKHNQMWATLVGLEEGYLKYSRSGFIEPTQKLRDLIANPPTPPPPVKADQRPTPEQATKRRDETTAALATELRKRLSEPVEMQAEDSAETVTVRLTDKGPWDFNDTFPLPNVEMVAARAFEGRETFGEDENLTVDQVVSTIEESINEIIGYLSEARAGRQKLADIESGKAKLKKKQTKEQAIEAVKKETARALQSLRDLHAGLMDGFTKEGIAAMTRHARSIIASEKSSAPDTSKPQTDRTDQKDQAKTDDRRAKQKALAEEKAARDREEAEGSARIEDAGEKIDEATDALESGEEKVNTLAVVARKFAEHLREGGEFKNILVARKMAKDAGFDGDAKSVEEAMELAVVTLAREIAAGTDAPKAKFTALVDLYSRQPKLGTRTSTSMRDQAFSTPVPLAYVASRLAGISDMEAEVIYEPSAGNGALLIEANAAPDIGSKTVIANEINEDRAANLRSIAGLLKGVKPEKQGFRVTTVDASDPAQAKAINREMDGADRVIANPPFGPVKEGGESKIFDLSDIQPGYKTREIDHVIVLRALEALRDDGRAVLLLGGLNKAQDTREKRSDGYNGKAKREFYKALYDRYNVTDHFTVAGELYERQGAGWPVDVVVIDGRKKSARSLPAVDVPRVLNGWDQIGELIDDVSERGRGAPERDAQGAAESGSDGRDGGVRERGERASRPVAESDDTGSVQRGSDERTGTADREGRAEAAGDERGDAGRTGDEPVAERRPSRITDFDAAFDAALDETFGPQAGPKSSQEPATPRERSTADVAKSAAKNLTESAETAMAGLVQLFGGGKTLGSGPAFDEETYAKAKPLFEKAAEKFAAFKDDIAELVKRMVAEMQRVHGLTREALEAMRPYLKRFIADVRAGIVRLGEKAAPKAQEAKPATERSAPKQEQETERQVAYKPQSGSEGLGTLVPVNMRTSIAEALADIEKRVGPLDAYVANQLDYQTDSGGNPYFERDGEVIYPFAAEQIDAIALAIDNIERGKGFIIGDQTGIGKGRVNAAILRWAMKKGVVPVFTTAKPNLYGDMYRDLSDIGIQEMLGRDLKILATNSGANIPLTEDPDNPVMLRTGDGKAHDALMERLDARSFAKDYDVLFTTYNQMQTVQGKETSRRSLLSRVASEAIFSFDESHEAGGQAQTRKAKGTAKNRAEFARDLIEKARGVFYSSATYAKRPDVMDLYAATDMVMAVEKKEDLGEAIARGGVPMQQVVAAMLAKAGQYIRRERSFAGVTYDTPVVPVDRELYDSVSGVLSDIQDFSVRVAVAINGLDERLKAEAKAVAGDNATGDAGTSSLLFTSVMHNVINQLLLAMKAKPAAKMAIEALERGEKPVITLANTMESLLSDYVEQMGLKQGDVIDANFGDVLKKYLDRTRTIIIKKPHAANEKKRTERKYLSDAELGPEGLQAYRRAKAAIDAIDFGDLDASPIDRIKQDLMNAGYSVGEITGRGIVVDYSGAEPVLRHRPAKETSIKGRRETLVGFNAGKIDVLMLNQAGSTGLSAHASEKYKDRRQRHMMIAQAEGNIDTHMQMLGRVHRTGQVIVPKYSQLVADIPAEKRPAAVLAKKMASLNANTTASRGGALTAKDVPDFMNEYGDIIAGTIVNDDPVLIHRLALRVDEAGEFDATDDGMRKVTGRIPLLPLQEQEDLYERLEGDYAALIEQMEAAGENALEAKTLDLRARPIERTQVVPARGGSHSPFAAPVYIERTSTLRQGKPFSAIELLTNIQQEMLGGSPFESSAATVTDDAHAATLLADLNDQYGVLGQTAFNIQGEQRDSAMAEFGAFLRPALDKIDDPAKQDKERTRLNATKDRWVDIHSALPIGARITLKTSSGNKTAIVFRTERTAQAKNPLALSSWKATFAVADGERQVTIPFSRLYMDGKSPSEDKAAVELSAIGWAETAEQTIERFVALQAGVREERYIATGNLLAAYDWLNMKGRIVNYTDEEGHLRQGILTSKDFDIHKHYATKARPIRDPAEIVAWLKNNRGKLLFSEDRVVRLNLDYQRFYITTDAKKRDGGRYYLDEDLKELTRDFYKRRNAMVADMFDPGDSALVRIVSRLQELGAVFVDASESKLPPSEKLATDGGKEMASRRIRQTDTPEFKRWFGKSKVVDENGEPMVVYHGTTKNFVSFDPAKRGKVSGAPSARMGFFFARNPAVASSYAQSYDPYREMPFLRFLNKITGGIYERANEAMVRPFGLSAKGSGENVMPVYLSVGNPLVVDFGGKDYREQSYASLIAEAQRGGHDGVVFKNSTDPGYSDDPRAEAATDIFVAFEPTQIKSATGNRGAFDPTDASILASRSGATQDAVERYRLTVQAERKTNEIVRAVRQAIEQVAGPSVAARASIVDRIGNVKTNADWGALNDSELIGSYNPGIDLVRIALAGNPGAVSTAYHEGWHAIEGALTPDDLAVLRRETERLRDFVAKNRPDIAPHLTTVEEEEIWAEAAAIYTRARDEARPVGGIHIAVRRIFERLRQIMIQLRNALAGLGFRSADDIFEGFARGEMAQRRSALPRDMRTRWWSPEYANAVSASVRRRAPQPGDLIPPPETIRDAWDTSVPFKQRLSDAFDALMLTPSRALWDRQIDLARFQKASQLLNGPVPESLDTYLAATLYPGRVGEHMKDVVKGLWHPIYDAMRDRSVGRDELHDYLYARHAPERNAKIREIDPANDAGSGMTDAEAADVMDALSDRIADFEVIANLIDEVVEHNRDLMLRAGLESDATIQKWADAYEHYVPLKGWEAEVDEEFIGSPSSGRGFDVRRPETERALGRFDRADDILANLLDQTQRTVIRAEKNKVAKTFLLFAQANPSPYYKIGLAEKKRRIDPLTGLVEEYWSQIPKHLDRIFAAKVGGKTYYIEIKHEGLLTALKSLGADKLNPFLKLVNRLTREYSRFQTAKNPEFVFTNLLRDLQDAGFSINAEQRDRLFKRYVANIANGKALFGAVLGTAEKGEGREARRWFEEWREAGGKISHYGLKDFEEIRKEIERELNQRTESTGKAVAMAPLRAINPINGSVVKFLEALSDVTESTTRLAVYIAARETGFTRAQAASLSRRATVDFNRRGKYGTILNSLYAFANASIQGNIRLLRYLRKSKAARKAMIGIILAGMLMTYWNMMMSPEDEEKKRAYEKRKYWERERNIIIYGPGSKTAIKIPLGYGINVFWMIGEQTMMRMLGKVSTTDALGNILGTAIDAFNPLGSQGSFFDLATWAKSMTPTVVRWVTELALNKDWADRPIHPDPMPWNRHLPKSSQHKGYTHPAAVALGQLSNRLTGGNLYEPGWLDPYPDDLEYGWNFAIGGLGRFLKNTHGTIQDYVDGVDRPPERLPFVRKFIASDNSPAVASGTYYTERRETQAKAQRLRAAVKARSEGKDDGTADEVIQRLAGELQAAPGRGGRGISVPSEKMFRSADQRIKSLRDEENNVRSDESLTRAERKTRIDDLRRRMREIMAETRARTSSSRQ